MSKHVKAAALRFLKIRPRSVAELKEKLRNKGFSEEEINTSLNDLLASGLLDDRAFTKSWINYRLARPFGFIKIIQELRAKGIDEEIIRLAMAQISNYSPELVAMELAQKRWQRLPSIEPLKKKKRVMDFLLRRGFEAGLVIKVINKLK